MEIIAFIDKAEDLELHILEIRQVKTFLEIWKGDPQIESMEQTTQPSLHDGYSP